MDISHPSIAVAVSGGIDSLTAAFLIKKSNKNVFGIHFRTGYESVSQKISRADLENALGMDVIFVDLDQEFEKNVVSYFVDTYLTGQTPNPCLVCNQHIKFGKLLETAKNLGAQYLATGHYAKVINNFSCPENPIEYPWLEQGKDEKKDQSYFLSRLDWKQLDHLIFPLAAMTKEEVRLLAEQEHLVPLHPSESQDICFVANGNVGEFIKDRTGLSPQKGNIVDMKGNTIGQHNGIWGFTLGQRRGINCPSSEPYYVKHIDITSNTLQVCHKKDLHQTETQAVQVIWNPGFTYVHGMSVDTKIRYTHEPAPSNIFIDPEKRVRIAFHTPQQAITPGQAAVFYQEKKIIGSAIIQ